MSLVLKYLTETSPILEQYTPDSWVRYCWHVTDIQLTLKQYWYATYTGSADSTDILQTLDRYRVYHQHLSHTQLTLEWYSTCSSLTNLTDVSQTLNMTGILLGLEWYSTDTWLVFNWHLTNNQLWLTWLNFHLTLTGIQPTLHWNQPTFVWYETDTYDW